jgi:hypothetical protein
LGKNLQIVVFIDENGNNSGYMIPVKNSFVGNVKGLNFSKAIRGKYNSSWKRTAVRMNNVTKDFDITDYYFNSFKNNKYTLLDCFDEPILPSAYDSISVVNNFIVAKTGKGYELYNKTLDKIDNMETYQKIDNELDVVFVLSKSKLRLIDIAGKEMAYKPVHSIVCGTTTDYFYKLENGVSNGESGNYVLKVKMGGMAQFNEKTRNIVFDDYKEIGDIFFFNRSKEFNSSDSSNNKIPDNWLLVKKNNKYGIVKYDSSNLEFSSVEKPIDSISIENFEFYNSPKDSLFYNIGVLKYKDLKTALSVELPIIYDSISKIKYNSFLRIYKDGLVGCYPLNKEAHYVKLDYKYGVFFRFSMPNGNKGWLDRNGNEFFDKKKEIKVQGR